MQCVGLFFFASLHRPSAANQQPPRPRLDLCTATSNIHLPAIMLYGAQLNADRINTNKEDCAPFTGTFLFSYKKNRKSHMRLIVLKI